METFTSAISPLLIVLKLFGVQIRQNGYFISKIQNAICRAFHLTTQLILVLYLIAISGFHTTKLFYIMFYVAFLITTIQNIFSRFEIFRVLKDLTQMVNHTEKVLIKFDGKEQMFLKKYRNFIRILVFFPILALLLCVVSVMSVILKSSSTEDLNKPMTFTTFIYFVPNYLVALPVSYFWNATVEAILIAQLICLFHIFRLLESFLPEVGNCRNPRKPLRDFIFIHRNACEVLQLSNKVLRNLMILWSAVQIASSLFHVVQFSNLYTPVSPVMMTITLSTMSVEIILAGKINQMVVKSLGHCQKFVYDHFPPKIGRKLLDKLELYIMSVESFNPGLTLGGISKLKTTAIIKVMSFFVTYTAFLCDRSTAVLHKIQVTPCDEIPCKFPAGYHATIHIEFTPKTTVDSVDVQAFGKINQVFVPFRSMSRSGCETLTMANVTGTGNVSACPMNNLKEVYVYKADVDVKSSYPAGDSSATNSNPTIDGFDTELGSSTVVKLSDGRRRLLLKRLQLKSKQNFTSISTTIDPSPFLRVRFRPHSFSSSSTAASFGDKHFTTSSPAFSTSTIAPAPLIENPHDSVHHHNFNSDLSQWPFNSRRHEPGSFFLPRPLLEDYEDYELFGLPQPHPWNQMFHHPKQQHLIPTQRRAFDITMEQLPRRFSQEQLSLNNPTLIPLTPASGHNINNNQNTLNPQSQFDNFNFRRQFQDRNFNAQHDRNFNIHQVDDRFGAVDGERKCNLYY
ncbi:hypothetical protein CHUAL_008447 [Chamberlinius hualienensis]